MSARPFLYALTAALALGSTITSASQLQRTLITDDAQEKRDVPVPHPLTWWTHNPLRLDESEHLLLGTKADGVHTLTVRDYQVQQSVTTLGTIADHRIVQVLTTIHPGTHVVIYGQPASEDPPARWKSLLVGVGEGKYVEIYALQIDWGLDQIGTSGIYGSSPNSILATNDPQSGNGGYCSEGYWWFDKAGAHPVDFTKLEDAIRSVIPKEGIYTSGCWALHPKEAYLESWVQRNDARCHACGGLGTVHASYRIQSGVVVPVSVHFEAEVEPAK
jgi:hypothetical protein